MALGEHGGHSNLESCGVHQLDSPLFIYGHPVPASLKEAGFRSGAQYLGIMRMAQAESNVTIPPAVELILKKSEDSLARGLGPACKAPEIRLHDFLFDNVLYEELPVIGGPGCYIVARSWLLREIDSPQSMHTQLRSRSSSRGTST